jgi:hypothetical protein
MPLFRCEKCGLIFAGERSVRGRSIVCDPCLSRLRRGPPARTTFDDRDAPLFRAIARDRQRTHDPRFMLGLSPAPGSIPAP